MWRGSVCSLVLFGLVLVITGLCEMDILPVWEQIVRKMMMMMMMVVVAVMKMTLTVIHLLEETVHKSVSQVKTGSPFFVQ